jgi:hypothetical protein
MGTKIQFCKLPPADMGGNSIRTSAGNLEITTASSSGAGNMTFNGKSAGITNINATTIGINASSILTMSATGAGAYMSATINDDISLTSVGGDIDLISNGAGKSINLTASLGSVAITATTDNLVLQGGTLAQLEGTGIGADVVIKPETTAGDLVFEGANIQSNTSGGNSGEHLRIKLNGVYYKIKLEND